MRISYDAKVDAVDIRFIPGHHEVHTKLVDDWIALDFDARDRLVSIEVLDASERLDLSSLLPIDFTGDFSSIATADGDGVNEASSDWEKLRRELLRRKEAGIPVQTSKRHWENWVVEVGDQYVVLRRGRGKGKSIKITRRRLEGSATRPYIVPALRELASSL